MVGQKSPSVAVGLSFGKKSRQPMDQVLAIFIVVEYFPAFYPLIMTCCKRPSVSMRATLGMLHYLRPIYLLVKLFYY